MLPGADAAVLRIKKTGVGIALSTDGNGRHCYLDPYRGGKAAVAEAARNVACCGATPIAITNCLNFGNPEKGPVAWQFAQAVEGMAEACEAFGIPVISGNVSFYNESFGQAIYPTPVVGMLGLLPDATLHCTTGFKSDGDVVLLLGSGSPALDGSEYQKRWYGRVEGRIPDVDLAAEAALQRPAAPTPSPTVCCGRPTIAPTAVSPSRWPRAAWPGGWAPAWTWMPSPDRRRRRPATT